MPRIARQKSESGIYHIIFRGTNRQIIYHDDEDCIRFLETIGRYKMTSQIKVYGWCLMGNHVHLLLREGNEEISTTMKRIGVSYAWFFNGKYRTVGHLFQDRYKSERVEDDEYLLTVIRYIHQNPIKAGITKTPDQWNWSSCRGYYRKEYYPPLLLDPEFILEMFSNDRDLAVKRFKEFNNSQNEDICIDDTIRIRLSDKEAREAIEKIIDQGIAQINNIPKKQRDELIKKIKRIEGLSQRQAARILGISPNIIFKT